MKETIGIGALLILLSSCASSNTPSPSKEAPSQTYTSTFPSNEVSQKLENIQKSVVRISSTAIYTTYIFSDKPLSKNELKTTDLDKRATKKDSENKSSAGTAIAIASTNEWGLLLTNHHVVNYPDTIINYVKSPGVEPETLVEAVAIKSVQDNLLYDTSNIGFFDILSVNPSDDLALLEINMNESKGVNLTPLDATIGDSKKLKLASVIYVMGYPKGFPMVTRAIISDPNRNEKGNFLTDALFNEGISGGVILASRNNYSSFEWVGIANASYADADYVLVPDPTKSNDYDPLEIYEDPVFVKRKSQLNYGITEAIPMQTIIDFLLKNKIFFQRRNMRLTKFE